MSVLDYAIRIIKATMKNHSNESFFPYFFIVGAGISVPEIPAAYEIIDDLFCLKLNVPFLRKCYAISRDSKIEFQDIWFSNFRTFDNRNVIRLRYSKTENRKNTTRKRNSCEKKQLC